MLLRCYYEIFRTIARPKEVGIISFQQATKKFERHFFNEAKKAQNILKRKKGEMTQSSSFSVVSE